MIRRFVHRVRRLIVAIFFIITIYTGLCFALSLLPLVNGLTSYFSLSFIHGESMLPFLKDGDLVVSKPFRWGTDVLKKGMVVRFRDLEDGETVIIQHRIEEASDTGVITMGDNNDSMPDGLIRYEQIESIYRFKISLHYIGMGLVTSFLFSMGNYIRALTDGVPLSLYVVLLLLTSILYIRIKSPG